MKTAGPHLLSLIVAGALMAEESAPASPTKTSTRLIQEIRSSLPKYSPPAQLLDQPKPLDDADPNVWALPKFTVKEKRPPSHDPDVWLTDKAVQQKAMAAYKQSLTDLEWKL